MYSYNSKFMYSTISLSTASSSCLSQSNFTFLLKSDTRMLPFTVLRGIIRSKWASCPVASRRQVSATQFTVELGTDLLTFKITMRLSWLNLQNHLGVIWSYEHKSKDWVGVVIICIIATIEHKHIKHVFAFWVLTAQCMDVFTGVYWRSWLQQNLIQKQVSAAT